MEREIVVRLEDVAVYHSDNPYATLTPRNREKYGEMVLSGINLEVRRGEFVYFIGRVGSGKSSLLKTLYAELPLVEGHASVTGFELSGMRQRDIPYLRRKIGIVFQDLQLLPERNVEENLRCVLRATGWKSEPQMRSRIEQVLRLVGLEHKHYKMPFELSGGEQQRLVIARALLNSPELIVADEPTGNLDPVTAEEIVRLFHRIAGEGTAVIMSTHNTSLIESFPSRTILFAQNRAHEIDINELLGAKSKI